MKKASRMSSLAPVFVRADLCGCGCEQEYLDTYSGWERDVEKMRARQPCGILEVESRKLKYVTYPDTSPYLGNTHSGHSRRLCTHELHA